MVIMFGIVTFGLYTSDRMLPAIFSPHWTHHSDNAVFKVNVFSISLLPMRPVPLIREVNFGLNTIMVIHTHSLIVNATLNEKSEERANFPSQSIS